MRIISAAVTKSTISFSLCIIILASLQTGAQAAGPGVREIAKRIALYATADDFFGWSVAISGDVAIVGSPGDYTNSIAGSAYILYRNLGGPDNWGQAAVLTPSDGANNDNFGTAVAISGDIAVVGADLHDHTFNTDGSAYVFSRNQGGLNSWGQVAELTDPVPGSFAYFGESVAISGDTVVVGQYHGYNGPTRSGAAHVFTRNQGGPNNWGHVAQLNSADGAELDHFGSSVAISGNTVIVGAEWDDDNGSSSGSAYVFSRHQGGVDNWGQVKKLTAAFGAAYDHFGHAVAVRGDTAIVGAWGDDGGGTDSGSAYIYSRHWTGADNWGQAAKLTASDATAYDRFGHAISISGDVVLVGAYYHDGAAVNAGVVYTFFRNQGGADSWGQTARLTASDAGSYDRLGYSVAIDGNNAIAGAYLDWNNSVRTGSVYFLNTRHHSDDMNDDGRDDILWRQNTSGSVYAWFMNGASVGSSSFLGSVADPNWQIVGSGDLNADGFTDVLWRHVTSGMIFAWLTENGAVSSTGVCGTVADTNWQVVDLRDTNGDGKADILWRHSISGSLYLWMMDGATMTQAASIGTVSPDWQIEN